MTTPRHDAAAERYVLGAVLLDNACLAELDARCTPDDHYVPAHRAIHAAMRGLAAAGEPIDVLTLRRALGDRVNTVGPWLAELSDACTTAHLATHATAVAACRAARDLAAVGREIAAKADDPAVAPADALAFAQARVAAVEPRASAARVAVHVSDVLMETFEDIEAVQSGTKTPGVRTGFAALDAILGGLAPGDSTILGGRPSQGKTSLALDLLHHAAAAGVPSVFFSLEMKRAKLGRRLLARRARVDAHRLRMGTVTGEDMAALARAAESMVGLPLWIDDLGELSPASLAAATRRHVRAHGPLGLVVIDYLGLMDPDAAGENTEKELKAISKAIKRLAGDLGCPIVTLAQLSRRCEERADKRPMLSDLRDSGSIEQDADAVMFVYRDEYYTKARCKEPGVGEVIVAKQRDGATGTAKLRWVASLTAFENLDDATSAPVASPPNYQEAEYDAAEF